MVVQIGLLPGVVSIRHRYPHVSAKYARSIASTFRKIIIQILKYPQLQVGNLDVVSDGDKQLMLSWNPAKPFDNAENVCMHHLVEAKARQMPKSEAVCAWDGSLNYFQLNSLSDAVAQRLVNLGVGRRVYVPFAFEKSMWTVVATLAILKAGGAFVPMNPNDPRARLGEILGNVNASVVVTMEPFVSIFEGLVQHIEVVSAMTVCLHHVDEGHSTETKPHCDETCGFKNTDSNAANSVHVSPVGPKDPIFVLFTSGSTGKPKGMIHEHAAICTHAITHGDAMGYHGARVLQFAAHTFDVAIIDIFTTLIFGGCICIPSEEDRRSNIICVINDMRADYAILTPSFAGLIEPSEVPTLKTLAIGGEALPQDRIQRWSEKVKLIQIYGPAEVGICLTMDMKPSTPPETIGYPLPNSSCWLVDPDDSNRLVPVGAVGELVVAGPSLTRGYLDNEAKTRTSFIEFPTWATEMSLHCSQFYKTGDLLRYNTASFDGSYDFVGRKDAQIKLRGQRIEPGEIEYHIGQIPGVAVSMVTRPEHGSFARKLVTVLQRRHARSPSSSLQRVPIVLSDPQCLTIESVAQYLSYHLPSYMIPAVCLEIENMPFVPSMKIDRRAVTSWLTGLETRPDEESLTSLPRLDPRETTAHAISQKVENILLSKHKGKQWSLRGNDFGLQDVGIDSIQIISLSMFLQNKYGSRIPMHALLSSKMTIRQLASLVEGQTVLPVNGQTQAPSTSQLPGGVDVRQETDGLSTQLFQSIRTQYQQISTASPSFIQNVFLTGATGYLGLAVLQQLLNLPQIQIYALIRCTTKQAGLKRIRASATTNGWWRDIYTSRLHIWQGNLTKPNLGLGDEEFQILHGDAQTPHHNQIHAIIHNGAKVHYSTDYGTLKPVNVLSTLSILEIMARNSNITTLVFVSGGEKPNVDSPLPLSSASPSYLADLSQASGYTQSKLVSEHLVRKCAFETAFSTRVLQIVKPGYIMGSITNGTANQSDFIWRLAAGCIEIGAYNYEERENWLFIADVERVARVVIGSLIDEGDEVRGGKKYPSGHVERVLDGLRFKDLWELLEEEFGYRFEALGKEEWMVRLRERVTAIGEKHMLFPLLHILERDGGCIGEKFEGIGHVEKVKQAVRSNVRYLIDVGFMPSAETMTDVPACA